LIRVPVGRDGHGDTPAPTGEDSAAPGWDDVTLEGGPGTSKKDPPGLARGRDRCRERSFARWSQDSKCLRIGFDPLGLGVKEPTNPILGTPPRNRQAQLTWLNLEAQTARLRACPDLDRGMLILDRVDPILPTRPLSIPRESPIFVPLHSPASRFRFTSSFRHC
jgi:hypothetical protein